MIETLLKPVRRHLSPCEEHQAVATDSVGFCEAYIEESEGRLREIRETQFAIECSRCGVSGDITIKSPIWERSLGEADSERKVSDQGTTRDIRWHTPDSPTKTDTRGE